MGFFNGFNGIVVDYSELFWDNGLVLWDYRGFLENPKIYHGGF